MEDNSSIANEDSIINTTYYEQMKDSLNCTICCSLISDPKMCSSCETPFCKGCISNWYSQNNSCPMRCSDSIIVDINRSLKKIFDGLKLKCKYDCEVPLLTYSEHIIKCEDSRREIDCFNCGKKCKASEVKFKSDLEVEALRSEIALLKEKISGQTKNSGNNNSIFSSARSISSNINNNINSNISVSNGSMVIPSLLESGLKTLLSSWISQGLNYNLIYKASIHGFGASTFHSKCDNKGPNIVIMRTNFNKIIGGFTPLSWVTPINSGLFYKDSSGRTFLFSYSLQRKYELKSIEELAICCNKSYGPIFGNYDLLTVDNSDRYNCGNYDIGTCYSFIGDKNSFYGGTPYTLREIEVYTVSRSN